MTGTRLGNTDECPQHSTEYTHLVGCNQVLCIVIELLLQQLCQLGTRLLLIPHEVQFLQPREIFQHAWQPQLWQQGASTFVAAVDKGCVCLSLSSQRLVVGKDLQGLRLLCVVR